MTGRTKTSPQRGLLRRSLWTAGAATVLYPIVARVASVLAHGEKAGPYEMPVLRYQRWASRVIYPELAADLGYLAPITPKWVGNTISGPQDIQAAVTGDTDFGGAFNSAIERLVAAGAPIKAVIGNSGTDKDTWPGLYVLSSGAVKGPRDLIGKKIAVNTLGAHDKFMIDVFLQRYGLTPAEIKQVTLVPMPPASAEHVLRLKQVDAAIPSDVFRDKAMATGGLDLLLTDYELFGALTTGSYVLTTRFIAENPNTTRSLSRPLPAPLNGREPNRAPRSSHAFRTSSKNVAVTKMSVSRPIGNRRVLPGAAACSRTAPSASTSTGFAKTVMPPSAELEPRALYTNEFNPYRNGQS